MTENEFREALRAEQGNYGERPLTPEVFERRAEVNEALMNGAEITFPATEDHPEVTVAQRRDPEEFPEDDFNGLLG